jgi:hypothetical protein
MKSTLFTALAIVTLLVAGCSSTPTNVNAGKIRAAAFSFVKLDRPHPEAVDKNDQVHAAIQDAIARNFAAKGVTRVASGGDVTVAYLVIVGNNASTTAINDYFGYGRDAEGLQFKAHDAYTSSGNPNYFEAGTIIVDVLEAGTYKLLYRNYATRPVLKNPDAATRAANIQAAVDEVLKNLKVVH